MATSIHQGRPEHILFSFGIFFLVNDTCCFQLWEAFNTRVFWLVRHMSNMKEQKRRRLTDRLTDKDTELLKDENFKTVIRVDLMMVPG